MRPARPASGKCPQPELRDACNLACKYNFFSAGELTIHSWELRCLDCGLRETVAYRSDETDEEPPANPACCPFCHACDLKPGMNPCS
jgi:hypothetical protein